MTPNIKPAREQMSDIIICSGGEPAHFMNPLPQAPKIIVLSCEEDLDLCQDCIEAGQPVHLVEAILGGVLRQKLDLTSYPINTDPSVCINLAFVKKGKISTSCLLSYYELFSKTLGGSTKAFYISVVSLIVFLLEICFIIPKTARDLLSLLLVQLKDQLRHVLLQWLKGWLRNLLLWQKDHLRHLLL